MILTEFPFEYFSDKERFSEKWEKRLAALSGSSIAGIYGAWDNTDDKWFDDAPMLVELEQGTLAVNVSSEKYIALSWNEILPTDKPRWFGEVPPLPDWQEDLEWREYTPLSRFKGAELLSVKAIAGDNTLNGLRFFTDLGEFIIIDDGDVIAGFDAQ